MLRGRGFSQNPTSEIDSDTEIFRSRLHRSVIFVAAGDSFSVVLPRYSFRKVNSDCDSGATLEQAIKADSESSLSSAAALALIRRIAGGDKTALALLYDKTSRLLSGLTFRILGDRAPAEETLLEVYTLIWRQASSYDPKLPPLEWLTTIARSRAVAKLQWSKAGRGRQERSAATSGSPMTVAPEQQKLVRSSVESLVPAQREILDWAYYSGLSCSEIAAQVGKPLGAVKTHARQGLNKLSELIHPLPER